MGSIKSCLIASERPPEPQILLLIDGECVLCNRLAKFVICRDPQARIAFAALGSPRADDELRRRGLPPPPPGTFVFLDGSRALFRSEASLELAALLPPPWRWLALLRCIPARLRDPAYSLVARLRYRIFGKAQSCALLTPDERARFLA